MSSASIDHIVNDISVTEEEAPPPLSAANEQAAPKERVHQDPVPPTSGEQSEEDPPPPPPEPTSVAQTAPPSSDAPPQPTEDVVAPPSQEEEEAYAIPHSAAPTLVQPMEKHEPSRVDDHRAAATMEDTNVMAPEENTEQQALKNNAEGESHIKSPQTAAVEQQESDAEPCQPHNTTAPSLSPPPSDQVEDTTEWRPTEWHNAEEEPHDLATQSPAIEEQQVHEEQFVTMTEDDRPAEGGGLGGTNAAGHQEEEAPPVQEDSNKSPVVVTSTAELPTEDDDKIEDDEEPNGAAPAVVPSQPEEHHYTNEQPAPTSVEETEEVGAPDGTTLHEAQPVAEESMQEEEPSVQQETADADEDGGIVNEHTAKPEDIQPAPSAVKEVEEPISTADALADDVKPSANEPEPQPFAAVPQQEAATPEVACEEPSTEEPEARRDDDDDGWEPYEGSTEDETSTGGRQHQEEQDNGQRTPTPTATQQAQEPAVEGTNVPPPTMSSSEPAAVEQELQQMLLQLAQAHTPAATSNPVQARSTAAPANGVAEPTGTDDVSSSSSSSGGGSALLPDESIRFFGEPSKHSTDAAEDDHRDGGDATVAAAPPSTRPPLPQVPLVDGSASFEPLFHRQPQEQRNWKSTKDIQAALLLCQEQCKMLKKEKEQLAAARQGIEDRLSENINRLQLPHGIAPPKLQDGFGDAGGIHREDQRASTIVVQQYVDKLVKCRHMKQQAEQRRKDIKLVEAAAAAAGKRAARIEEMSLLQEREGKLQEECLEMVENVRSMQKEATRLTLQMKKALHGNDESSMVLVTSPRGSASYVTAVDSSTAIEERQARLAQLQEKRRRLELLVAARLGKPAGTSNSSSSSSGAAARDRYTNPSYGHNRHYLIHH